MKTCVTTIKRFLVFQDFSERNLKYGVTLISSVQLSQSLEFEIEDSRLHPSIDAPAHLINTNKCNGTPAGNGLRLKTRNLGTAVFRGQALDGDHGWPFRFGHDIP